MSETPVKRAYGSYRRGWCAYRKRRRARSLVWHPQHGFTDYWHQFYWEVAARRRHSLGSEKSAKVEPLGGGHTPQFFLDRGSRVTDFLDCTLEIFPTYAQMFGPAFAIVWVDFATIFTDRFYKLGHLNSRALCGNSAPSQPFPHTWRS
jgi:hypothetical protein